MINSQPSDFLPVLLLDILRFEIATIISALHIELLDHASLKPQNPEVATLCYGDGSHFYVLGGLWLLDLYFGDGVVGVAPHEGLG